MITDRTLPIGVRVSDHIKVHYQFCTMFMPTHQEILYLKSNNSHYVFEIPGCPGLSKNNPTSVMTLEDYP